MLFPDYKNTTSVTLTTNTNPSYTVTQDCMVYTRFLGVSDNGLASAVLFIDDINLWETALSSDFGGSSNIGVVTLFIKAGSTVSVKVTQGVSTNSVSVTLRLIPLTNMGGGVTTYLRLRHEQSRMLGSSINRNYSAYERHSSPCFVYRKLAVNSMLKEVA